MRTRNYHIPDSALLYRVVILLLVLLSAGVVLFANVQDASQEGLLHSKICLWFPNTSIRYLLGGTLCVFASILMYGLNNAYTIIKARSSLHSVLFLLFYMAFFLKIINIEGLLIVLLLALSLLALFSAYASENAPISIFLTHVCLGFSLLILPALVWLILFYFLFFFVFRIAAWQTLSAAIMGLSMAFIFFFAYAVYTEQMFLFEDYFKQLFYIDLMPLSILPQLQRWQLLILFILLLWSSFRYIKVRYRVKIRVRVYLDFIILFSFSLVVLINLYPLLAPLLLPSLLMGVSFFIGRFLSFSRRKIDTIVVFLFFLSIMIFSLI